MGDEQGKGWRSPAVVSKAREGKQNLLESGQAGDRCPVLGPNTPSHCSQTVPSTFTFLTTVTGFALFLLGSDIDRWLLGLDEQVAARWQEPVSPFHSLHSKFLKVKLKYCLAK